MAAKQAKTPQQIADAWDAAMKDGRTQKKYRDGINNYQGNPMAQAATADALAKYQMACEVSVSSGRRAKALNDASVTDWKNNATTVGATNLGSGATKAKAKYTRKMQFWAGVYAQASSAAAGVTDPLGKVRAAINVMKEAAGLPAI